jgi:hypothetical protein
VIARWRSGKGEILWRTSAGARYLHSYFLFLRRLASIPPCPFSTVYAICMRWERKWVPRVIAAYHIYILLARVAVHGEDTAVIPLSPSPIRACVLSDFPSDSSGRGRTITGMGANSAVLTVRCGQSVPVVGGNLRGHQDTPPSERAIFPSNPMLDRVRCALLARHERTAPASARPLRRTSHPNAFSFPRLGCRSPADFHSGGEDQRVMNCVRPTPVRTYAHWALVGPAFGGVSSLPIGRRRIHIQIDLSSTAVSTSCHIPLRFAGCLSDQWAVLLL